MGEEDGRALVHFKHIRIKLWAFAMQQTLEQHSPRVVDGISGHCLPCLLQPSQMHRHGVQQHHTKFLQPQHGGS
jgi:hypothetical protein